MAPDETTLYKRVDVAVRRSSVQLSRQKVVVANIEAVHVENDTVRYGRDHNEVQHTVVVTTVGGKEVRYGCRDRAAAQELCDAIARARQLKNLICL